MTGSVSDLAAGLACVCRGAAEELVLDQVSVTLMTPAGSTVFLASSSAGEPRVEELYFDLGEGPGPDAYAEGRPVLVPDLSTRLGRWPGFTSAAIEAGMHAVFVFPLQLGAVRLGVLTCACAAPRQLDRRELTAGLIMAEVATELVLDSASDADHPDQHLHDAMHAHDQVYQAQGMVMIDLAVTLTESLARMRAVGFAEGLSLRALAAEIVAGRRSLRKADDP